MLVVAKRITEMEAMTAKKEKQKSSTPKYFLSFLTKKEKNVETTKRRSTYQKVDIVKSIRHHGRLVLIKIQRLKPARNSFCFACYTDKINI